MIVNEFLFLAHQNVSDKKHTTKPEKGNSDKTIYVEICTISSFFSHTQKAVTILKRGSQEFQKILEEQTSESEIVSLKFSPIFRPKLREEQKKSLHSNSVRFFAQN